MNWPNKMLDIKVLYGTPRIYCCANDVNVEKEAVLVESKYQEDPSGRKSGRSLDNDRLLFINVQQ